MFKKISISILVVIVVAMGVTGLVMAQEPTPPTDRVAPGSGPRTGEHFGMRGGRRQGGPLIEALAEALSMTVQELHEALSGGQTVADVAEAQGVALQDVVDALIDAEHVRADERIAQMEENLLEALESGQGFGKGMGHSGHRGQARGGHREQARGQQPEVLAEALGMTVQELHEALSDGQTVADVAEAQGIALQDVADALVAAQSERLQQAVDDGRITQEQADERITQMEEHILQMLESGEGMRHGSHGHQGGMRGGFQGDDTAAPGFPGQAAPSVDL